jgi:hypothetical protein
MHEWNNTMDRRIDAHIARTQFGQIMDLATKNNERFIVDRRGEPAVVIMSVQDFIRTVAPPPDWLEKAWTGARRRGIDTLTPTTIDVEVSLHRHDAVAAVPDESKPDLADAIHRRFAPLGGVDLQPDPPVTPGPPLSSKP